MKYCSVNLLRKELCGEKRCAWVDIKFIQINLFSIILCSEVPHGCSNVPQSWGRFLHDASSEKYIDYIKMGQFFYLSTFHIHKILSPSGIIPLAVNNMSVTGLKKCFLNFAQRCPHLPCSLIKLKI